MAAMKEAGVHVSDIIKKQIDQHTNFELKTEYSKDKYKKKKEAKYAKVFTTIPPTLFNVCEYWYNKDQGRIRDLRIDALSQMLNLANIRPGGRYLVVDDASGLVVSGVLHRMGGQGRVLTICDVETPPAYPVMTQMNFPQEFKSIMASLNWATCQEDYTPIISTWDVEEDQIRSEKQRIRVNKRRAASDLLQSTREDLFAGEFEAYVDIIRSPSRHESVCRVPIASFVRSLASTLSGISLHEANRSQTYKNVDIAGQNSSYDEHVRRWRLYYPRNESVVILLCISTLPFRLNWLNVATMTHLQSRSRHIAACRPNLQRKHKRIQT
ncbi:tRNA (adenine(58)-N(1))-methyltransferase non-catalytic [Salix suchowensis]|nr:tRNA (adenine(58)-N(1))-methyltransferase non-catalytic [Salix suchowensis]